MSIIRVYVKKNTIPGNTKAQQMNTVKSFILWPPAQAAADISIGAEDLAPELTLRQAFS